MIGRIEDNFVSSEDMVLQFRSVVANEFCAEVRRLIIQAYIVEVARRSDAVRSHDSAAFNAEFFGIIAAGLQHLAIKRKLLVERSISLGPRRVQAMQVRFLPVRLAS